MKELTIEQIKQKAIAYDEAVAVTKKLVNAGLVYEDAAIQIFPELKESEDEKIRNFISNELACIRATDEKGSDRYEELTNAIAWLEKQGEQKSKDKYTFKSIPRLLEVIKPTDRAKAYCQKLIDSLLQEGYTTDAKIVSNCLKQMNGEKVAMATMDEQKSADKAETKFHEGDWIVFNGLTLYIKEVVNGFYRTISKGGITNSYDWNIDNTARLWTIHEAIDGDVLNGGTTIFIFKDLLSDGSVMSYCDYDTDSGESDAFCPLSMNLMCSKITPVTKEQYKLLFQKMKEASYQWNAEKKELNKIEQNLTDFETCLKHIMEEAIECGDTHNLKADAEMLLRVAHKLANWTEDDERIYKVILEVLNSWSRGTIGGEIIPPNPDRYIKWFKSFKDRVQPKQEWKQENTGDLTDFENVMMHIGDSFFGQHASLDPNNTNAIKEQANLLLELIPSKEWSEEDKGILLSIKCVIDNIWHSTSDIDTGGYSKEELKEMWEWLDKIWQRVEYHEEKQGEQNHIYKVEPKFHEGDTIVEKDIDECGYGTIKDIKDGQYIFTNGSSLNINEQEGWRLVKTSTNYK